MNKKIFLILLIIPLAFFILNWWSFSLFDRGEPLDPLVFLVFRLPIALLFYAIEIFSFFFFRKFLSKKLNDYQLIIIIFIISFIILLVIGDFDGLWAYTAYLTKNLSFCRMVSDNHRDVCILHTLIEISDESLCEEKVEEGWRNNCYSAIAERKKDPSLCEKISDIEDRGWCYSKLAKITKNLDICEKISDQVVKEFCYTGNYNPTILDILVDGESEKTVNIMLPISKEEAIIIVKDFCESKYPSYQYNYDGVEKINDEWIVKIPNINCVCGATINEKTGETKCQVDLLAVDKKLIYPDDFILKSDEIPSGFQLEVPSKESMEFISLTGNPGFFDNERYRGLFTGADSTKIEKFHASFYIKPESPLTELGIYVIKYKSKEDCDFELAKLKVEPREDSSYLRNEDILVMIWSDAGDYQKEVREITSKLRGRLNLEMVVASTEVRNCMEEFPVVDFKSCIPGKVIDGWTEKVLYPNTLDTSDIDDKKSIDSPIPEKVKDAAIALYNSSMSNCKNSWFIKESGEWKEVSQIEFCEYAVDYLYSCNKCLLEWEGGCC
jgi:hypothetical protein